MTILWAMWQVHWVLFVGLCMVAVLCLLDAIYRGRE